METINLLLNENKEEKINKNEHFSFKWFAKKIIERQKIGKDTNILVIGERRNGKTTWALKLIKAYIKLKREENPNFSWSWKDNFPITKSQAINTIERLPEESFMVIDEAGDIAYKGDTLQIEQKKLIKIMLKSGKKRMLNIIVLPDINLLDTKILNLCIFLVAVPYRYKDICSFAFIYGRMPNPFISDKFGLERIKRIFQSRKTPKSLLTPTMKTKIKVMHNNNIIYIPYPKELFLFLKSLPNFLMSHRFNKLNKNFEEAYIKNVKNKQLLAHNIEDKYIKRIEYDKILHCYKTILYNLFVKNNMSISQIERLHYDKKGNLLAGKEKIKRIINSEESYEYRED